MEEDSGVIMVVEGGGLCSSGGVGGVGERDVVGEDVYCALGKLCELDERHGVDGVRRVDEFALKEMVSAKERAENYQKLLHELVAGGLFEMEDGQVRMAKTEGEKVDMRAKLLDAGHELQMARRSLERAIERRASSSSSGGPSLP